MDAPQVQQPQTIQKAEIEEVFQAFKARYLSRKLRYSQAPDCILVALYLYLQKERIMNNIILLSASLEFSLYSLLANHHNINLGFNYNNIEPLNELGFKITPAFLNKQGIRLTVMKYKSTHLKGEDAKIRDSLVSLLSRSLLIMKSSPGHLPSSEDCISLNRYINAVLDMHAILDIHLFNVSKMTSHEVLERMIEYEASFHKLFPAVESLIGAFFRDSGCFSPLSIFFHERRQIFFTENVPGVIPAIFRCARLSLFNESHSHDVFMGSYGFSMLKASIFSQYINSHNSLELVHSVLSSKISSFLTKLDLISKNDWPGRKMMKSFALFSDFQLKTVDSIPVSVGNICEAGMVLVSMLPKPSADNLSRLRSMIGPTTQHILKLGPGLFGDWNTVTSNAESEILQNHFCDGTKAILVDKIFEIIALAQIYIEIVAKTDEFDGVILDSRPLIIFDSILLNVILEKRGAFKGLKGTALDEKILEFCQVERRRLGLTLEVQGDLDTIVKEIESVGKPEKTVTELPAKKKKSRSNKRQVAPEVVKWDDEDNSQTSDVSDNDSDHILTEPTQEVAQADKPLEEFNEESSIESPMVPFGRPYHFDMFVDEEDLELLDTHSSIDIAHAYIFLGNHVYVKFISPFLEELQIHNINLYPIFGKSLDRFKKEIRLLRLNSPLVFNEALKASGVQTLSELMICLALYSRRLTVAHPHLPRSSTDRRLIAEKALENLAGCTSDYSESGLALIKEHQSCFVGLDYKPNPVQKICNKEFDLSVLILAEYFKTDELARTCGGSKALAVRDLRCEIAHQTPTPSELEYCVSIFKGHRFHDYLSRLVTDQPSSPSNQ